MNAVLGFFAGLPPFLVYLVLGAGAALENLVPPIPADTFVLLGGFLAARGRADAVTVFLVTWGANVTTALAVYWVGLRHGRTFFETGLGRHVLNPHQMERMRAFYGRWGIWAVFLARFLPGLRAVVPAAAGVSHMGWLRVAPPVAIASGLWYGALVWLGVTAGRNLDRMLAWLDGANLVLLALAALVFGAAGVWWWRTRKAGHDRP